MRNRPKLDDPIKFFPMGFGKLWKRTLNEYKSQRDGGHQENKNL